ncbi:MAG TPA: M23 family metallopeptidase [Gaiellaceae bacterium]|jgi:murein DD-endopeptidase MepM/ murein hydrolase activator NlpD|nr:M23 family metallopeptidase [Gaiellaceae bacterium]
MPSPRTTARAALVVVALGLAAGSASAQTDNLPTPPGGPAAKGPQPSTPPVPKLRAIVFPVVGPARYYDDFGEPRAGRPHQGNDIVAPKRALAVAAEAGKVKFWTTSRSAGCMLYLRARSGTTYLYIHLNNDLGPRNDNRGRCVAGTAYTKGLKSGDAVAAGQPVGFVGDSGDADGAHAHLHFEVHPKGGKAVSPFPDLRRAHHLLFAARAGTLVSLELRGTVVATPAGRLTIRVSTLTASTRLKVSKVDRNVVLSLPADAVVAAATPLVTVPRLAKGKTVTVATEEAPVTLAAELGSPGALSAGTITVAS